jgi:hypothetical protein
MKVIWGLAFVAALVPGVLAGLFLAAACVSCAVTDASGDQYFITLVAVPFLPLLWVANKLWNIRKDLE